MPKSDNKIEKNVNNILIELSGYGIIDPYRTVKLSQIDQAEREFREMVIMLKKENKFMSCNNSWYNQAIDDVINIFR